MYVERDGVKLFYDVQGDGDPTLLFVHGWMMSHEVWREQVPVFSQDHKVVSIGLRGFGQSDKPDGEYTLELFADDIDFMVGELGLNKPVFIGWSMGASIGLLYATAHSERLSKLVLVDGTPLLIASEDFNHAIPPEAGEQLVGALQADFTGGARAFVDLMFPEPGIDELKNWVHGITQQTKQAIALNTIANVGGRDLRVLLKQISLPTLILYGEQDQVCLPGASRYMHEQIQNSDIYEFPGKGHVPFLTDSEEFNKRLRAFLSNR